MKNLQIRYAGRLGNFFIKICHVLHMALYYNYNVILPKHEFFNTTYIIFNKDVTEQDEKITNEHCFFWIDLNNLIYNGTGVNSDLYKQNHIKIIEILKKIFIVKSLEPSYENDLLIHIRSGDIFYNEVNPQYICPPLSYYIDIIEKNNFNKIILISENRNNPCINKLLEIYPKIQFKEQTLYNDIILVLSATNIVTSFGSFLPPLLELSDNIKNVYYPGYSNLTLQKYFNMSNSKYKSIDVDLWEYYNIIKPWKNTPEQIEIMMNYKK